MTYTLSMAADQGIRIADDGVAEVSMTEARANLTRLIRAVREGDAAGAFTERGERRAYVVPPATVLDLLRAIDEIPGEHRGEPWAQQLIGIRNQIVHGV